MSDFDRAARAIDGSSLLAGRCAASYTVGYRFIHDRYARDVLFGLFRLAIDVAKLPRDELNVNSRLNFYR